MDKVIGLGLVAGERPRIAAHRCQLRDNIALTRPQLRPVHTPYTEQTADLIPQLDDGRRDWCAVARTGPCPVAFPMLACWRGFRLHAGSELRSPRSHRGAQDNRRPVPC